MNDVNTISKVDVVNMARHDAFVAISRFDGLLAAAADLLDGAGAATVTLRDVASAVGVSHNATMPISSANRTFSRP